MFESVSQIPGNRKDPCKAHLKEHTIFNSTPIKIFSSENEFLRLGLTDDC